MICTHEGYIFKEIAQKKYFKNTAVRRMKKKSIGEELKDNMLEAKKE